MIPDTIMPCPNCGERMTVLSCDKVGMWDIMCLMCSYGLTYFDSYIDAIALWNEKSENEGYNG